MKVWEIATGFGFDHLRLVDRPEPKPGPNQIVVRVQAISLNYRDLLMVKGMYNPKLPLPRVPCSDGAGEVMAIGNGVSRVQVEDRVAGIFMQNWLAGSITDSARKSALGGEIDGMLAQQVLLSEDGVVPIPKHMNLEQAATLPCAAVTAWNALTCANPIAGETVLIQGTGGVSIFALQMAYAMGLRVLVISSSDDKLQKAKALGANAICNYRSNPDWDKWCRKETGIGVDHVIEVGGAGTLEKSMQAVRTGGHISLIGILSGTGTTNPLPLLMKAIQLQGIYVGSRAMFEAMNRTLEFHQIKPFIDRVFGFADFPDALRYLESGSHFGKIVVRVD